MPRFIIYILIAIGTVVFFQFLANNFADEIGYVERKVHKSSAERAKEAKQTAVDIDDIEELIDKKIAERDTITLEVVTSNFMNQTSTQEADPLRNEKRTPREPQRQITQQISIKNPNLNDQEYFERLKEEYYKTYVQNIPEGRSRTDVIVRYYKHNADGENVYKLNELRYYIHERDASDATIDMPSNAIFYGDNIKSEDVQIVAYTLLENGVPIKTIRPSKFGSDWKSNSIEIGTDTTLFNNSNLTLAEVRGFIH